MFNLPNILTLLRILLIPVFVGLFYYPSLKTNLLAAIVFIIAALTDFVDGYLARKLKQTTKFGAFLDPVADKIIVCTALVLIVEYYSVHVGDFFPHINLCVTLPSIVIIAREIVVSALREWMAEIGQRAQVAVNWVGKWKTAIQMIAIAGLIWRYNDLMIYSALFMLMVATILTIMSMVMYLKVGLAHMFEDATSKSDSKASAQAIESAKATPDTAVPDTSVQDAAVSVSVGQESAKPQAQEQENQVSDTETSQESVDKVESVKPLETTEQAESEETKK